VSAASGPSESVANAILRALAFAASKHRDQRRKGARAQPFINHAIEVADLVARVGGVDDPAILQAAILHDTLEDTTTTSSELEAEFGARVTAMVAEVTDDKLLPIADRKRLQVERAPRLSRAARLIRLADKISNVRAIGHDPPLDWSLERRRAYVNWSGQVIEGCRGSCQPLERLYDEVLAAVSVDLGSAGSSFEELEPR